MRHTSINRVKGDLKYNRVYQCDDCSVVAIGDTESTAIDTVGPEGAADHLRRIECAALNPYRMPVGWSSNYKDGDIIYRCTNCVSRRKTDKAAGSQPL